MSYSRRQLYALGEPLGDSATYRKADGGLILGDGGGGGGSQPANTTSTTTQTAELPEWARGYAKEALAKGQALTDVNQNPYQQYTGARIAGFSPMQQQAMQNAAGMSVAPQIGEGTSAATMAGTGGLGVAGQANPYGFQSQVGGYMNPYLQYALAPQLAEANRQYDVGATKQQSAATQAGAFGGAREAIMAAENERNRNMALQNIVGQGYNTAFQNAQQQYNQNLQNQLAGYDLTGKMAGQLGQLGQQQYQQGVGINQLQAQYGAQQQALQQQGLTQAYQDFINQQNYPYKQLGFMSDLIRGLPLGQQSTAAVYQPPGSIPGQIAGLGLGALGFSRLAGMAEGGSVEAPQNIEAIVSKLSDVQLAQALQAATQRGDTVEMEAIKNEQAMRVSERKGLASTVTTDMADEMMPSAANGGIVAFADEGLVRKTTPEKAKSRFGEFLEEIIPSSDEPAQKQIVKNKMGSVLLNENINPFQKVTPEQRKQIDINKELAKKQFESATTPSTYSIISSPADKAALEEKIRATMGSKVLPAPDTSKVQEQIGASENWGKTQPKPTGKKGLAEALAMTQPAQSTPTTTPEQDLEERTMSIYRRFKDMNKDELKGLTEAIEAQKGEADKIKSRGLAEALMHFGFNMAANASKPGARFIGSAASASPAVAQIATENEKLQTAARDNYNKLRMDQTRYQIALDKNDLNAATALASQIRQGQMQQKQLDALIDYHNKQLAMEGRKLGIMGAAYAPQSIRETEWLIEHANDPKALEAFKQATRGRDASQIGASSRGQIALEKNLMELRKRFPMLQLPSDTAEYKKANREYESEARKMIESHRKYYNEPTLGSPEIGGGSAYNPDLFKVTPVKKGG